MGDHMTLSITLDDSGTIEIKSVIAIAMIEVMVHLHHTLEAPEHNFVTINGKGPVPLITDMLLMAPVSANIKSADKLPDKNDSGANSGLPGGSTAPRPDYIATNANGSCDPCTGLHVIKGVHFV